MKLIKLYLWAFVLIFLLGGSVESSNVSHDPFIIHAIPKCGVHFIERVISQLTDKPVFHQGLSENALSLSNETNRILRIFGPYNPSGINLLIDRNYKVIAMHRDPRDALVSHLFYMRTYAGKGNKRDFFTVGDNFDSLSFDDQLTALILGSNGTQSYVDYYQARTGWALNSWSLPVKFEDLVGQEGGGDDRLKRQAIIDIANYLGIELSADKLQYVMNNMYKKEENVIQNDKTFVRSSVGNWKLFFNNYHKKTFKKRFGKKIIELGYEKNNKW